MFYDINKTLTYNALFNFIVSQRGLGKTFGFKEWSIRDFIRSGNQFMYVRRYKDELLDSDKFFANVAYKFPDHDFSVDGHEFIIDHKVAGYALALSTSIIKKSTSYPDVNKIGFDEFIIDKSNYHYLADEVVKFLELYETVARLRDDVRVFFLSNAITQVNPYFMHFNIRLPRKGSTIWRKGDLLLEMPVDEDFSAAKKATRFGKLIAGSAYAAYAIDNQFLRDTDTFLEHKSEKSQYSFTFIYKSDKFGVWMDWSVGKYFVSRNVDPSCRMVYAMTLEDHSPNTMLLSRAQRAILIKPFIDNYRLGNVYCEDIKIKGVVYEVIKMILPS